MSNFKHLRAYPLFLALLFGLTNAAIAEEKPELVVFLRTDQLIEELFKGASPTAALLLKSGFGMPKITRSPDQGESDTSTVRLGFDWIPRDYPLAPRHTYGTDRVDNPAKMQIAVDFQITGGAKTGFEIRLAGGQAQATAALVKGLDAYNRQIISQLGSHLNDLKWRLLLDKTPEGKSIQQNRLDIIAERMGYLRQFVNDSFAPFERIASELEARKGGLIKLATTIRHGRTRVQENIVRRLDGIENAFKDLILAQPNAPEAELEKLAVGMTENFSFFLEPMNGAVIGDSMEGLSKKIQELKGKPLFSFAGPATKIAQGAHDRTLVLRGIHVVENQNQSYLVFVVGAADLHLPNNDGQFSFSEFFPDQTSFTSGDVGLWISPRFLKSLIVDAVLPQLNTSIKKAISENKQIRKYVSGIRVDSGQFSVNLSGTEQKLGLKIQASQLIRYRLLHVLSRSKTQVNFEMEASLNLHAESGSLILKPLNFNASVQTQVSDPISWLARESVRQSLNRQVETNIQKFYDQGERAITIPRVASTSRIYADLKASDSSSSTGGSGIFIWSSFKDLLSQQGRD